jgi:hypothetical protein
MREMMVMKTMMMKTTDKGECVDVLVATDAAEVVSHVEGKTG